MRIPHLGYANVVSTLALALVVTGGGVAVAGGGVGRNAVGSGQIKNGAVRTVDLARGAVTGAKVRDNSLTGADVRESTLDLPSSALFAGERSPSGILTDGFEEVASVSFEAPADGYALVTVQAATDPSAEGGYVGVLVQEDRPGEEPGFIAYANWEPGDPDGFQSGWNSLATPLEVTAGSHTYRMGLSKVTDEATTVAYQSAQVIVQFYSEGEIVAP